MPCQCLTLVLSPVVPPKYIIQGGSPAERIEGWKPSALVQQKHLLKILLAWQDAQLDSTAWPCFTPAQSHGPVRSGSQWSDGELPCERAKNNFNYHVKEPKIIFNILKRNANISTSFEYCQSHKLSTHFHQRCSLINKQKLLTKTKTVVVHKRDDRHAGNDRQQNMLNAKFWENKKKTQKPGLLTDYNIPKLKTVYHTVGCSKELQNI